MGELVSLLSVVAAFPAGWSSIHAESGTCPDMSKNFFSKVAGKFNFIKKSHAIWKLYLKYCDHLIRFLGQLASLSMFILTTCSDMFTLSAHM